MGGCERVLFKHEATLNMERALEERSILESRQGCVKLRNLGSRNFTKALAANSTFHAAKIAAR